MHDLQTIVAMNNPPRVGSLDEVREYIATELELFNQDPPDTIFQRGYLASLLAVAKEALHEDMHAYPYANAEALVNKPHSIGTPAAFDKPTKVNCAGIEVEVSGPYSNWPRECW